LKHSMDIRADCSSHTTASAKAVRTIDAPVAA
jgi:hypothetical protein